MLIVNGKPILSHIIERAASEGFQKVVLSIHYLGHKIREYFGDGSQFGLRIEYINEDSPLGTAGSLSLLDVIPTEPFIVTNGDIIADVGYLNLLDFHCRQRADATMAVSLHEWQNPYGVVQTKGLEIISFEEKPIVRNHINAGVYALSPIALKQLSPNQPCDMPTLFERMKKNSLCTLAYPMHEPWLDVGRPEDLLTAQNKYTASRKED